MRTKLTICLFAAVTASVVLSARVASAQTPRQIQQNIKWYNEVFLPYQKKCDALYAKCREDEKNWKKGTWGGLTYVEAVAKNHRQCRDALEHVNGKNEQAMVVAYFKWNEPHVLYYGEKQKYMNTSLFICDGRTNYCVLVFLEERDEKANFAKYKLALSRCSEQMRREAWLAIMKAEGNQIEIDYFMDSVNEWYSGSTLAEPHQKPWLYNSGWSAPEHPSEDANNLRLIREAKTPYTKETLSTYQRLYGERAILIENDVFRARECMFLHTLMHDTNSKAYSECYWERFSGSDEPPLLLKVPRFKTIKGEEELAPLPWCHYLPKGLAELLIRECCPEWGTEKAEAYLPWAEISADEYGMQKAKNDAWLAANPNSDFARKQRVCDRFKEFAESLKLDMHHDELVSRWGRFVQPDALASAGKSEK